MVSFVQFQLFRLSNDEHIELAQILMQTKMNLIEIPFTVTSCRLTAATRVPHENEDLFFFVDSFSCFAVSFLRDCTDISKSGVYHIYPKGEPGYEVYCDMATDRGGWTVRTGLSIFYTSVGSGHFK